MSDSEMVNSTQWAFNVDSVWNFILPVIKYPTVLLFLLEKLFGLNCRILYPVLGFYSLILWLYLSYDNKYKKRGPWISIRDVADPVCVITGGSLGLGNAIVQSLLKQIPSLKVVILDVVEPALGLNPSLSKDQVEYLQCDLSSDHDVENAIKEIKLRYSKVDLLINNAAIRGRFSKLADMPAPEMAKIFQANVLSTIRLTQAFYPKSSTTDDCYYVVNVASALGLLSPARASTYAASKAAMISYHESWSYELLADKVSNVRTLLVLPGQMDTQMFKGFEPPRQFLAPVVKPNLLAEEIVDCCIEGKRGEICKPFYVNFLRMMKCFPEMIIEQLRAFSKMDECLPVGQTH